MITVFAIIKHVSKNLNNSEHELQNLRFQLFTLKNGVINRINFNPN